MVCAHTNHIAIWGICKAHRDTCSLNTRPRETCTETSAPCLRVTSRSPLWCQSLVCSTWFLSINLCLSASHRPSMQAGSSGRCCVLVCAGPWGPRARAMPPHVHPGWKVRTLRTERSGLLEGTCLLCSACLSLGKGWHGSGERREEEREMRGKRLVVQLRTNDRHSRETHCGTERGRQMHHRN